ncbi:MAG: acetyl-CoA carboxylase, biotin carboxyl carrier protein [Gammaproteobacteria bacterium]|nr:acetyl-CoA carboxylase, biotin carboxyl carrier protein [Gammaproteobacteria bacterium]|tara:strand:- start:496 stop:951 length:456 start_codon:yes stop_codon:yes gene_type:complete
MDLRKIKKLMELLEESGIAEIEVKEGEESIRLSRSSKNTQPINQQIATENTQIHNVEKSELTETKNDIDKSIPEGDSIKSPMVGTFYRAASPDSKPFVEKGKKVNKGDTVCILEAMKMMNQVTAEKDGVIVDILVEDAEPVEFGQTLFIIK